MEFRNLIYTSPSGVTLDYSFLGELNDSIEHDLGTFNFALVDNRYSQDSKVNTGNYSFTLILDNEYDVALVRSVAFEKKTSDSYGELQHPDPTLGSFPVVLVSANFQSNVIKDINTTYVTLVFQRDISSLSSIKSSSLSLIDDVTASIDELNESQQEDFSDAIKTSQLVAIANSVQLAISAMGDNIGKLSKSLSDVESRFNLLTDDILYNLDTLVYTPLLLAEKIQNLVQLPMEVNDSVNNRINSYNDFIDELTILTSSESIGIESGDQATINNIATRAVFVLASVSALNYCAVTGKDYSIDNLKNTDDDFDYDSYYSRAKVSEVLHNNQQTANNVIDFFSDISSNFSASSFFKQYIDKSILSKKLLSYTDNALNSKLLSLPSEKTVTLTKPTTPLQLCVKYYDSASINILKFFLKTNSISGKEIYLLKKNREIVVF